LIPSDELDSLLERDSAFLAEAMALLTESIVRRLLGEYVSEFVGHEETLAGVLRAVNLGAATEGAKRSLLLADGFRTGGPFPPSPSSSSSTGAITEGLPPVPPTLAIRSLLEREPRLLGVAEKMADIYGKENVFSVAKATSSAIVEEAQKTIASMLERGVTVLEASKVLSAMGKWTRAYSETVYRTNAASAYTNGMFAMTGDPAVAGVIGALRYVATRDSNVRSNHLAYDGLIASPEDPIWHVASPPQGFNCRCSVELVPWADIPKDLVDRRTGKVNRVSMPSGAYPDPGFKVHAFNPGLAVALAH